MWAKSDQVPSWLFFTHHSIAAKAQEICQRTYGKVSLKEANTHSAIKELKTYYVNNDKEAEDQEIRQKMIEALAVDGFAAWIIHNAIKRNNNKYRKGLLPVGLKCLQLANALLAQQAMQASTPPNPTETSAEETKTGNSEGTSRAIFDPVRNI